MRKAQTFYIYRFSTDRLKEKNYNIKEITIFEARKNAELVGISDSEMTRTIYRVTGRKFSKSSLDDLLSQKRKISKKKNSSENRKAISSISEKIDSELFIPEIISLKIIDKRHYQNIIDKGGFKVNGKTYVPFIFSAGLIRRNTGLFIESSIKDVVMEIFDNGRDKSVPIVPAKYNSYLGLYSSSTLEVTYPRIAIVPDLVQVRKKLVDFASYVGEGIDPVIEEVEKDIEFNFFDGCGLVSPKMAKIWSSDLELDYVGSTFGIRSSWLKGMCVVMDFHKFAREEAEGNTIKDIYGNEVDIRNIDVIVSPSMFKLWDSYKSTEEYVSNCRINNLGWGISKVNPKTEKSFSKTSYQFLQVLNIEREEQIEGLCRPTVDWISKVSGGDISFTLLYALGDITDFSKGWFDRIDPVYQALILDNKLIKDSFLISHLDKSLVKRKHDSKKGNLFLNGNYQAIIPDSYLYCCHIFGIELKPLLNDGESYSNYWNEQNVSDVVGIRSPIVFQSEIVHLKLKNDEMTKKWFGHISSGIILPGNGVSTDFALLGGADGDFDLLATINSSELLECRTGGLPVLYDTKKPPKIEINKSSEMELVNAQMKGFGSKVGFFTNISSTLYALLYNFPRDSLEYRIILDRLKWGRVLQGQELDKQKGLVIPSFPNHWVKYKKITDDMSELEKNSQTFNNKILAEKRPLFFIYLYDSYMRKYKKEQTTYNNISLTRYDIDFETLRLLEQKTQEQKILIERYERKTYFIDNNSPMNLISRYMEDSLKNVRTNKSNISKTFDYSVLLSKSFKTPSKNDIEKVKLLYKEYKSLKRSLRNGHNEYDESNYSSVEEIFKYIRLKAYSAINSNERELSDILVYCVYEILGTQSKGFMWNCFGKDVVDNIKERKKDKFVRIPMPSKNGNIKYLWKNYGNFIINIEE